jgi:hypothetical protein
MKTKIFCLGVFVCLSITLVSAQVSTCPGDPLLLSDGTPFSGFLPASTTHYFWIRTVIGHSYSLQATFPFDAYVGNTAPALSLLAGNCTTVSTLPVDITNYDPSMNQGLATRVSFIADNTLSASWFSLSTSDGHAHNYTVSITDTTLHNPRWSTFAGFITQWAFRNTSNLAINGTLTVTDVLGIPPNSPVTLSFSIPAGSEVFKIIGNGAYDINAGASHGGFAQFAFIGPPGAISADAYFINPGATVIVPSKFEPRNSQH